MNIGEYTIEVEKENFFTRQQNVLILHNQLSDVGVELEEKPGSMLVSTSPQNVRIFLDGQFKGRSPLRLKTIPKGDYNVSLSLPFAAAEKTISVKPNQEALIDQSFKKSKDYIIPMTSIGAIILVLQLLTN